MTDPYPRFWAFIRLSLTAPVCAVAALRASIRGMASDFADALRSMGRDILSAARGMVADIRSIGGEL